MSDTPETDEQINGKPCTSFYVCAGDTLRDALVPSEFARKLERERDEAREEAGHWKTEYEIVVDRLRGRKHPRDNGIIADDEIIPKLERERDEARVLINETERFADRFRQERDKAREDATNYYAKICELREDLEVLRSNKMGDPLLEITFRNLISERDELKCKIKELDQTLKASAELLCFFFEQSGITKEDLKERLEAAK